MSTNPQEGSRPTVVLVHGAFAESASWNGVIRRLQEQGYNIPLEAHRFMAERAQAREVVEIEGASHAVGVSHPKEVADTILRALKDVE
jgi:pimeloyl-ACP methyl ester carboxylesterase